MIDWYCCFLLPLLHLTCPAPSLRSRAISCGLEAGHGILCEYLLLCYWALGMSEFWVREDIGLECAGELTSGRCVLLVRVWALGSASRRHAALRIVGGHERSVCACVDTFGANGDCSATFASLFCVVAGLGTMGA